MNNNLEDALFGHRDPATDWENARDPDHTQGLAGIYELISFPDSIYSRRTLFSSASSQPSLHPPDKSSLALAGTGFDPAIRAGTKDSTAESVRIRIPDDHVSESVLSPLQSPLSSEASSESGSYFTPERYTSRTARTLPAGASAYPDTRSQRLATTIESTVPFAKMVKNRGSLQAVFIPSFLHNNTSMSSPTSTVATSPGISEHTEDLLPERKSEARRRSQTYSEGSTSTPGGRVSPSTYLLDDDPFANLSSPMSSYYSMPSTPLRSSHFIPNEPSGFAYSALPQCHTTPSKSIIPSPTSSSVLPSPDLSPSPPSPLNPYRPSTLSRSTSQSAMQHHTSSSISHHLPHPAHTRPAFNTRPSLPSLSLLARMAAPLPARKKKGTVGAGLPLEPWDSFEVSSPTQLSADEDEDLFDFEPSAEEAVTSRGGEYDNSGFHLSLSSVPTISEEKLLEADSLPDVQPSAENSSDEEVSRRAQRTGHATPELRAEKLLPIAADTPTIPYTSLSASATLDKLGMDAFPSPPPLSNLPKPRPESLTIDPGMRLNSSVARERDSSALPLLSTRDEDDPFFSLSPIRTYRNVGSDSSSESYDTSLHSLECSPTSPETVSGRHNYDSGSESSLGEELGQFDALTSIANDDGTIAPRSSSYISHLDWRSALDEEFDGVTGWKPYDAKAEGFEPGSSASTIRPLFPNGPRSASEGNNADNWATECAGGYDLFQTSAAERMRSYTGGHTSNRGRTGAGTGWDVSGGYGGSRGGEQQQESSESDYGEEKSPGDSNNRGDRGDDEDDKNQSVRSVFSSSSSEHTSDSESPSQSDADDTEDDYGHDNASIPVGSPGQRQDERRGTYEPSSNRGYQAVGREQDSTEDDDIPLAQRIPGALSAQKSIRRQVRDERVQRRRDRVAVPSSQTQGHPRNTLPSTERGRTTSIASPRRTALRRAEPARSQDEHKQRNQYVRADGTRRERARTIGEVGGGVAAYDLTKRLLQVQAQGGASASVSRPSSSRGQPHRVQAFEGRHILASQAGKLMPLEHERDALPHSPPSQSRRPQSLKSGAQPNQIPAWHGAEQKTWDKEQGLKPARLFHGSSRLPTPAAPDASLQQMQGSPPGRSATRRSHDSNPTPVSRSGGIARDRRPSNDNTVERSKLVKSPRTSHEGRAGKAAGIPTGSNSRGVEASPGVTHIPSVLPEAKTLHPATQAILPLPISSHTLAVEASQTRIFISDLQRFKIVEIRPDTNAKSVVEMVEKQGELKGDDRKPGAWMVWEMCQEFGIERPIRDFELLAEISGSWNVDKMVNMFMIKKTPLASVLSSMPESSPKCGGYVEWESKKGKWSKRWLELREHSLWISKREGKGEECLCSLSGFDAYFVTRIHKAPKPFVFAVKSTEPISLFENTADYLHVFSCSESSGKQWMESILLARSYVIYQERNVLFRQKDTNTTSGGIGAASSLSRSGTRKQAAGSRPTQPLVNVAPPFSGVIPSPIAQSHGPFEPGSLLAKRTADSSI